jgi:hypothetical protein
MANKSFRLGYFMACILLSVLGSSALGQDKVPATTEEARSAFENADAEPNAVCRAHVENRGSTAAPRNEHD